MSEALMQRIARGVDDVGWGIEIRFSNLEMNDVPALCFQRPRLLQNLKRGLGAEARHTLCKAEFIMCGLMHRSEPRLCAGESLLSTTNTHLSEVSAQLLESVSFGDSVEVFGIGADHLSRAPKYRLEGDPSAKNVALWTNLAVFICAGQGSSAVCGKMKRFCKLPQIDALPNGQKNY